MSYGLVGAYAIYFILVGIKGNASPLYQAIVQDGRGFIPWILAIFVLKAMYSSETLRPVVKPFIGLAILVFVVKNFSTISSQLNAILPANVQIPAVKGAA